MKNKIVLLSIFMFLLLGLVIVDTYGLFETNANSTNTYEIGKWQILLNGEDVTLDKEITLNDFTYETDSHTEEGYLSPGGKAILDIIMDASNADTAISYSLNIDTTSIEEFPNLNVKVVDLENNEEMEEVNINGTIKLDDIKKKRELRMTLEWINDPLEDENDIKVIEKDISFPISMHFSQLKEE